MNEIETKVFKETRLRNLRRTYAKLLQHPELVHEAHQIEKEIQELESAMT